MSNNLPSFSFIIPTYNRPQQLVECLRSIAALDYPKDKLELIIVDDGSPSPLDALVAEFAGRSAVKLERQERAGPAAARNAGAELACGKYLAFVDDDCALSPSWLQAMASLFRRFPSCAATGHTTNALPRNLFAEASQMLIDFLYSYYNSDPLQGRFFTSNNLVLPAELFHAVGGFDRSFPKAAGEDRELCDRLVTGGHRVVCVPEAVVHHSHHFTLASFLRQHFNYGHAAFRFQQLRAVRHERAIKVEPLAFYLGLLSHSFKVRSASRALASAAALALTQLANAAGFFWGMCTVPREGRRAPVGSWPPPSAGSRTPEGQDPLRPGSAGGGDRPPTGP